MALWERLRRWVERRQRQFAGVDREGASGIYAGSYYRVLMPDGPLARTQMERLRGAYTALLALLDLTPAPELRFILPAPPQMVPWRLHRAVRFVLGARRQPHARTPDGQYIWQLRAIGGAYERATNRILLRADAPYPSQLRTLAHEMRHAWQAQHAHGLSAHDAEEDAYAFAQRWLRRWGAPIVRV